MTLPSYWKFAFLMAVSLALWWRPIRTTLRLALDHEEYTHILLIVPLSCALIYQQRKAIKESGTRGGSVGLALLAIGLLAVTFAHGESGYLPDDGLLAVSMGGLVAWWIGAVVFCFGLSVFRSFLFPLCFLFWIVPLPEFLLNRIVHFLQQGSAWTAQMLFRAAGTPVTQDGIMLSIPALDIEVARACSSIRSSLVLVITTMVLGHLLLRSWWRKALLIALAIPLSFVKNGLRIFVVCELGMRDPAYFEGWLHRQGGFVFLSIALVVVVGLLWTLRRAEIPSPEQLVIPKARG
jgi:exosortase